MKFTSVKCDDSEKMCSEVDRRLLEMEVRVVVVVREAG